MQFGLIFFAVVRGLEILASIKKAMDSYSRVKKLSQTMGLLKKVKGKDL
jgi:hypothetical protein